ncbi:hypothetical protein MMC24_001393 [Lignoscripta atroalba]|nr:hypothetical protein [Lignoscripta atroalba]
MAVLPRQYYGYPYDNRYRSPWNSYGRWATLSAILFGTFLLFLLFACITARRRRRAGLNPYRGTGWLGNRAPVGHAPAQYTGNQAQPHYGNNQYDNSQPPVYTSPPNQGYYGNGNQTNQGYFGGQQSGIELQQPQSTYQPQKGGDPVYSPPAGPPPGKGGDGIIR